MKLINDSVLLKIDEIHPNPKNPNTMSEDTFKALKDHIKKSGLIGNILVRENPQGKGYEIIDGEHRYKAAKELGYSEINAIILDVNDINATIELIRFNREKGYFEEDKLKNIVNDLINRMDKHSVKEHLHLTNMEFKNLINTEELTNNIKQTIETETPNMFNKPKKSLLKPKTEENSTPKILNKSPKDLSKPKPVQKKVDSIVEKVSKPESKNKVSIKPEKSKVKINKVKVIINNNTEFEYSTNKSIDEINKILKNAL